MELEVEDTDEPFRFLSSMLHVNKNNFNIDAKFYNKNQIQIDSKKPQIFPTYQHFTSYAPMRQKLAVAISAIHRVGNACNSTQGAQEAFDTLRRELELLKYPTQIIRRRALWRVRNTDSRFTTSQLSCMGCYKCLPYIYVCYECVTTCHACYQVVNWHAEG